MSRFNAILMLRWGAGAMLTFVLASLFAESAAATVRQLSRTSAMVETGSYYAQVKQPKGGRINQPKGGAIFPKGTVPRPPKGTVSPPPKGTAPRTPKGTVPPPPVF
ncbi:hypothetical protein [Thermoleptolyngbya sp.]